MANHSLYNEEAIAEETKAFNARAKAMLATIPRVWEQPPQKSRDGARIGKGILPAPIFSKRAYWLTISGRSGDIFLRILPPASGQADRIYYHIHGGGWVLGAADTMEPLLENLADATNSVVVSVEYRLAPEHPYPAGPEDCEDGALWLVKNAKEKFGTHQLCIGGESAGAHLAVLTLLRMRDNHGYSGFTAANLIYGCYDLSGTPSLMAWGSENLVLDTPTMQWFFEKFISGLDSHAPAISPIYANLQDLPPALFTVGTLDPLLDDSLFMFERWQAAGNSAELAVYPGGIHAFNAFPLTIAREANNRSYKFLCQ
jgi:acetyl esterase